MGSVVGNYQIIRKLGEGGMGAVYLAQHTLLGRRAALKMLLPMLSARPDVVNRFFNEARATTSISDPGIVQIFDFGYHTDGSAYIVMEYLEGEPLDRRLANLGRLPIVDALRLTRQVATSLAAAHAQQIVHRDLKPENIYLVRDAEVASGERPKILDFGIAKLSDDQPGKVKTHTGALMGTPLYMSPEQCRGAAELDHRSDVYSLGCVLFHLIAGAPPFDGEGLGDIIAMHLREPAPALSSRAPGITPHIDALMARCLAKRPDERFQSMHELAAAIGRVLPQPTSPPASAPTQLVPVGYVGAATPPPGSMNAPVTGAPITGAPTPWPTPTPTPAPAASSHLSTPTTLGSGTGQVTPAGRPVRWVLPLLAVLVVGGGVLGTVIALGGGGDADTAAVTPASGAGGAGEGADAAVAPPPDAAPAAPVVVAPDAALAPVPVPADAAPAEPADAAMAAIDGPAHAPPDAAKKVKRPKRPQKSSTGSAGSGGSGAATPSGCDRRIDEDCDGIPDVR